MAEQGLTRFSASKLDVFLPDSVYAPESEGGEGLTYGEIIRSIGGLKDPNDEDEQESWFGADGNLDYWKINDEILKYELTREQQGRLMVHRFEGYGNFNDIVDAVKNSFKILGFPEIDTASAAALVSIKTNLINDLISGAASKKHGIPATRKITDEDVRMGLHTQAEKDAGIEHVVLDEDIKKPLEFFDDDGMFDFDLLTPEWAASTPYDFKNNTRIYGRTITKDGKEVETGEWYTGSEDPGWSTHSTLGSVYADPDNPNRKYSRKIGWINSTEENGNWFQSEETGDWLLPQTFSDGEAAFLVAPEGIDPTPENESKVQSFDDNSFYSFNRNDYYKASLKPTEISPQQSFTELKERQDTARNSGSKEVRDYVDDPAGPNATVPSRDDWYDPLTGKPVEGIRDWYTNKYGTYFQSSDKPDWKMYDGDSSALDGWVYTEPDTNWYWQEDKGWIWGTPDTSDNYFYHNNTSNWAWREPGGEWVDQKGKAFDFSGPKGSVDNPPRDVPRDSEGRIASPVSYANRFLKNESGELNRLREQLNNEAQKYRNIGASDGMINRMLKGTSIYKKIMSNLGGEDAADARILVDDIVNQVAKVNAAKANIAGNLDMADNRGFEMLDPRLTQEQKGDLRFAKPSITASQYHVDEGLADSVGQFIRNPDYDPNLSMYFEHINPETGEMETRAFRSDMAGKAPFMRTQEKLIDASVAIADDWADTISKKGEDGLSDYDRKYNNIMKTLQDAGISDVEGGDGLYTREGIKQLNYIYGDDRDSMEGKTDDLFEAQRHLQDKSDYYSNMGLKDQIDKRSRLAAAQADIEPLARERVRGAQRMAQARFGEGIDMLDPNGMEAKLSPKIEPKDISSVSGLGNGYTADELLLAGIGEGSSAPEPPRTSASGNQYLEGKTVPG